MNVLDLAAQEQHQLSGRRREVEAGLAVAILEEDAQFAAMLGAPRSAQVQDRRNRARIVAAETVEVALVGGAGRIVREVGFDLDEAEVQPRIERGTQLVEAAEQTSDRSAWIVRRQPLDRVATDAGVAP